MTILHRNLALLRVVDVGVLDEIRAVAPLDDYVLGSLSPTEILVDPQRLKSLLEVLEARGMAALVKRVGS
jgi:hypothetical protein